MKTKLKIRVDSVDSQHVRFTIFMGDEGSTLANCGTLCMNHPEYQLFATAPLIAAPTMKHHFVVEIDEKTWTDYHNSQPTEE